MSKENDQISREFTQNVQYLIFCIDKEFKKELLTKTKIEKRKWNRKRELAEIQNFSYPLLVLLEFLGFSFCCV